MSHIFGKTLQNSVPWLHVLFNEDLELKWQVSDHDDIVWQDDLVFPFFDLHVANLAPCLSDISSCKCEPCSFMFCGRRTIMLNRATVLIPSFGLSMSQHQSCPPQNCEFCLHCPEWTFETLVMIEQLPESCAIQIQIDEATLVFLLDVKFWSHSLHSRPSCHSCRFVV